jgi:hypothetical protein
MRCVTIRAPGVSGEHQWRNAALACALAGTFLQRTGRQHLLDVDDRNNMAPGLADVAQFTALCAAAPLAPLGAPLDVRVTRDALPATFARALERCRWPGRTQLIDDSASNVSGVCRCRVVVSVRGRYGTRSTARTRSSPSTRRRAGSCTRHAPTRCACCCSRAAQRDGQRRCCARC